MSLMGKMAVKGMMLLGIVLLTWLLAACNKQTPAPTEPVIRPVKLFKVEMSEAGAIRHFPGRVEASQRAELAFRVSGTLDK